MKRLWLALLSVALLVACGDDTDGTQDAGADAGGDATGDATGDVDPGVIPDTPAGEALQWFIDAVNAGGDSVTPGEFEARFEQGFRNVVSYAAFVDTLDSLNADQFPLDFVEIYEERSDTQLVAVVEGELWWRALVTVGVESAEPHRIGSLFIADAPELYPDAPTDWAQWDDAYDATSPLQNFYAAELVEGACTELHSLNDGLALGVGSAFKLWVLSELVDAIAAGSLAWDDRIAIRDDWRSLPSGNLWSAPAGDEYTIEELALEMIRASDNTATDHLLRTLGRDAVEAQMLETGVVDPSTNRPFIATREMFLLKLALSDEQRRDYIALDAEGRREFLDSELGDLDVAEYLGAASEWIFPIDIDAIEWFFTGEDLCGVMARLLEQMSTQAGEPIGGILSNNPGLQFPPGDWQFVGFKGGSEPGVLNLTYLFGRDDDRWFFLTGSFNDTELPIQNQNEVFNAIRVGARVLSTTP